MPHPPGGAGRARPPRPGPAHPTRRQVLRGGVLGAGALALGASAMGCGTSLSAGSDRTLVRFWSLFQGGDGERVQTMLADVGEQAPGLRIEPTTLAWGPPYYTKLAMASVGGRAPETAIMHLSRLPGYAPGGLLEPFDLDLLAEFGVRREDFVPELWSRGQYDGAPYAIPLDTHPFIVFYDTEMADKAGLLDSGGQLRAFDSPDDFVAASYELAGISGANGVAFGHVNDDSQGWRLFWNLYRQTGADMRLPAGGPARFDRDAALRAYSFMADLFDGEHSAANLDYQTALAAFSDGRAGMIFTGEWELPYLSEGVENLGAAAFPTIFENPGSYADSHSFVLPRQSSRDPERVRAAHRFVALMLRNSLTWGKAGHLPAYTPVATSEAYRELEPQSDYAAAGETPLLDPEAWFAGAGSTFHSDMSQTVRTALTGAGPQAAVEQLDRTLASWVARENPAKGDAS